MSRPAVKLQIVACVVLLQAMVGVQYADAYTLMDWMRTWPTYYGSNSPGAIPAAAPVSPLPVPAVTTPPTIMIPPGTSPPPTVTMPPSTYSGAATPATTCSGAAMPATTCASAATTSSPSTVYAPAASTNRRGGCCDWLFGRRSVGYQPQVRYRNQLMRVPTTNYRPVTAYDPVTGTATTSVQPCTAYTWQYRRVPRVMYRPVYPPTTTGYAPGSPVVTGYYPETIVSGANTTCAPPVASPAAPPYYAPPATPAMPTLPPIPTTPTSPPAIPQSPTPADQPPALSPTDLPPVQNGQSGLSTSNYPPLEPSGESTDPAPHEVKKEPKPPAGDILDLTPVPDPDAEDDRKQIPAAPSLFNPNDRTANKSARSAWAYSTIAWPERPKEANQQSSPTVVTKQDVDYEKEELDSSGWHAVRP